MKKLWIVLLIAIILTGCSERLPDNPSTKDYVYKNVQVTIPYDTFMTEENDGAVLVLDTTVVTLKSASYEPTNYTDDTFNGYPALTSPKFETASGKFFKHTYVDTGNGWIEIYILYGGGNLAGMFELYFKVIDEN